MSLKFVDIGLNLSSEMFKGIYHGKQRHAEDILCVLNRAKSAGVHKSIVTGGNLSESMEALQLCRSLPAEFGLFCTVGIHPTRSDEFFQSETTPEAVASDLKEIIRSGMSDGRVVAIGECGLDYDRLEFCDKPNQAAGFLEQLKIAEEIALPMFLHDRNTDGDFLRMVTEHRTKICRGGVVHSYTGTLEDMIALTNLGLYIGVNGCSLKTEENLRVVAAIPSQYLLLETDAPWCGIKNTHAGKKFVQTEFPTVKKPEKYQEGFVVKDRCEPCMIVQVNEVVAAVRNIDAGELAEQVYNNTLTLFFSEEER